MALTRQRQRRQAAAVRRSSGDERRRWQAAELREHRELKLLLLELK